MSMCAGWYRLRMKSLQKCQTLGLQSRSPGVKVSRQVHAGRDWRAGEDRARLRAGMKCSKRSSNKALRRRNEARSKLFQLLC